jgi:hypothetical protein
MNSVASSLKDSDSAIAVQVAHELSATAKAEDLGVLLKNEQLSKAARTGIASYMRQYQEQLRARAEQGAR